MIKSKCFNCQWLAITEKGYRCIQYNIDRYGAMGNEPLKADCTKQKKKHEEKNVYRPGTEPISDREWHAYFRGLNKK